MYDVKERLDSAPLSGTQKRAIALTAVLNGVDGYDVLSMTFAAPAISAEWQINKAELGIALSSGLIGMALGSFFLAPLADRFGRRNLILATLVLMTTGMVLAALSESVTMLAATRILAGLGLGALVPINAPLAMEYSNAGRRRLALGFYAVGYPLGGTLGGFAAAMLLQYTSWHAVFLLGAALSALMLVVSYFILLEPPAFLLAKRPPGALEKLNLYLQKCGQEPLEMLPPAPARGPDKSSYRAIFARGQVGRTITAAAANLLFLMTVYYVLSWLPQLVADLGYSSSFATVTSSTLSLLGVAGCMSVGLIGKRMPLAVMAACYMIGLMAFTAIFGFGQFPQIVLLALAGAMGLFLYGGVTSIYGVIVEAFPPAMRATGVGFGMGMGRVAGAITPAIAGLLFYLGMGRFSVSLLMSLCALLGASLLLSTRRSIVRPTQTSMA